MLLLFVNVTYFAIWDCIPFYQKSFIQPLKNQQLLIYKTGEKRAKDFLLQRISIEIQRGNSAPIFGTFNLGDGL